MTCFRLYDKFRRLPIPMLRIYRRNKQQNTEKHKLLTALISYFCLLKVILQLTLQKDPNSNTRGLVMQKYTTEWEIQT